MTLSLLQVEQFLRQQVAPDANRMDWDAIALKSAFHGLGSHSWLALRVPPTWQGAGVSDDHFRQFQELVARYSGALAFLQAQHQSAGVFLVRSENESLKQTYLPQMATGQVGVGVGFSHLRRAGKPSLQAIPVTGGYRLQGQVPWITGFGIFQAVIVAAVLPDDRAVYGLVPLTPTEQEQGGCIYFSEPMALAAMTSTQTVQAELRDWWLASEEVVLIQPAQAIHTSDVLNVLQHSFFALGCARAGLDVMADEVQRRSQDSRLADSLPMLDKVYQALEQEWQECRSAIHAADYQPFEERLNLRAWAIELMGRCAHAAVTISAGAANSLHHPAQRIYREALVFTVAGQTSAVMQATLSRFIDGHQQKLFFRNEGGE